MADEYNYLPSFFFKVDFHGLGDDNVEAHFQDISGIQAELSVEEIEEGGLLEYTHRLPKRTKYPNLVLKRALSSTPSEINKWVEEAIFNFRFKLCQVSVSLLKAKDKEEFETIKTWTLFGAYPLKVSWSDLNASKSGLVIETLELAYRYAVRSENPPSKEKQGSWIRESIHKGIDNLLDGAESKFGVEI